MKKKERDDFLNEFSVRLKDIRLTLKMTQEQFSNTLGISKPTYVRYELGEMMPKIQILQVLGARFNVNLNWLFRGEEDMSKFVISENVLLRELSIIAESVSRLNQFLLGLLPGLIKEAVQEKEDKKPLT